MIFLQEHASGQVAHQTRASDRCIPVSVVWMLVHHRVTSRIIFTIPEPIYRLEWRAPEIDAVNEYSILLLVTFLLEMLSKMQIRYYKLTIERH